MNPQKRDKSALAGRVRDTLCASLSATGWRFPPLPVIKVFHTVLFSSITAALLSGCGSSPPARQPFAPGELASFHAATPNPLLHHYYDGDTDDLLTAGLGITGLQGKAPAFADPLAPRPAELRRNRIHYNYNALVNTAGGFGRLYGPEPGAEKIAGHEYLTVSRYPNGDVAATLMVQVPDSFDPDTPCIVAAPSSGSRGVYGAIGTAGQWGLSKGCAVAYTDKGTGTGFYLADGRRGYDLRGRLVAAAEPGVLFAPAVGPAPRRVAVKHSHSGHNVEKDWGAFTLQSIQFAFRQLNLHHAPGRVYNRENTLVIASSISNGGGGALKAAEQDSDGWIDAVVVAEPSLHFAPRENAITVFDDRGVIAPPRPLLDIATHFALYQGCASMAAEMRRAPLAVMLTPQLRRALGERCQALANRGLLSGASLEEQAGAARQKLLDYGVLPQTLWLGPFSTGALLWEAIAVTYANAYGRYTAAQPACGISFAFTDPTGKPAPMLPGLAAGLATLSSGIVPVAGIQLIDDRAGEVALHSSLSFQAEPGESLRALLCLRDSYHSKAVRKGLEEITFSGDLHGKPAIIVHGRDDALIHVNHSSRPYLALNREREGSRGRLRYYEITRGQHFDALLRLPGFAQRYIPLHHYYDQALNIMWSHLTRGTGLPPSQVVYAQPATAAQTGAADGKAADGVPAGLPPIREAPAAAIRHRDNEIHIP